MRLRALLSIACLIGLAVASIRPQPLTLAFIDRTNLHQEMTILPDGGVWWPDYPRFLEEVRWRTKNGDSVAVVAPSMNWDAGYSYAYYRASYFLAGREVLPLVTPDGRSLSSNFNRAEYLAIWHNRVPAGAAVVFAGNGGVLVRR
jgi:hypothetical protein